MYLYVCWCFEVGTVIMHVFKKYNACYDGGKPESGYTATPAVVPVHDL